MSREREGRAKEAGGREAVVGALLRVLCTQSAVRTVSTVCFDNYL